MKLNMPVAMILSWTSRVMLFLLLLFEMFQQNLLIASGAFTALVLSLLPAIVFKDFSRTLPRFVELGVTISLLLHIVGLTFNFYHNLDYWWWDQMTHFLGTAVIASLAFEFIFTLNYTGKIKMSHRLIAVFTFCVAMTIGALWEISEFYFDKVFETHSLGDLYDTLQDLQFNTVGGLVVAFFGAWYQKVFEKRHNRNDVKVGEVKITS